MNINDDELTYSFWVNNRSLNTLDQLRNALSKLLLRKTFRMTFVVAIKLTMNQKNRRTFAKFESKKKRSTIRNFSLNSRIVKKSAFRKFLNVSLTLRLAKNVSMNETFKYLIQKIDKIDEWEMKLIKTQNQYNDMLHKFIRIINHRLNQLQIFITQINEKFDLLTKQRKPFNSFRKLINFLFRKFTFDWSLDRLRSFFASKFIETFQLVSTSKKKKFRESNINFFNFTCFESHDKSDYVTIDDRIHYRNVWLFLNSADAITTIKNVSLIRFNLHRCFRNDA